MTLILVGDINGVSVIMSDLLTSNHTIEEAIIESPISGYNDNWGYLSGLTQKMHVIREKLVVAWAGSFVYARGFILDLENFFLVRDVSMSAMKDFMSSSEAIQKDHISVVGFLIEGRRTVSFCANAESIKSEIVNNLYAAGTGCENLKEILAGIENFSSPEGQASDFDIAVSFFLQLMSTEISHELSSRKSLFSAYGGGYEIAACIWDDAAPLRIAKLTDFCHFGWVKHQRNGRDGVSLLPSFSMQEYDGDYLVVFRWMVPIALPETKNHPIWQEDWLQSTIHYVGSVKTVGHVIDNPRMTHAPAPLRRYNVHYIWGYDDRYSILIRFGHEDISLLEDDKGIIFSRDLIKLINSVA